MVRFYPTSVQTEITPPHAEDLGPPGPGFQEQNERDPCALVRQALNGGDQSGVLVCQDSGTSPGGI
jgi:hypothetical protein